MNCGSEIWAEIARDVAEETAEWECRVKPCPPAVIDAAVAAAVAGVKFNGDQLDVGLSEDATDEEEFASKVFHECEDAATRIARETVIKLLSEQPTPS
jgi:hypothetical protein